jgi:3-deoxy-D-manno-octulosonate 8-phosphate phosphatase (KDO 8-P phosphatase)
LPDLPVMKRVGLAVAVSDAHEIIRQMAHITTRAPGGKGAVREISETILKAQGLWDALISRLFDD